MTVDNGRGGSSNDNMMLNVSSGGHYIKSITITVIIFPVMHLADCNVTFFWVRVCVFSEQHTREPGWDLDIPDLASHL